MARGNSALIIEENIKHTEQVKYSTHEVRRGSYPAAKDYACDLFL